MKILYIPLNEYDTLKELQDTLSEMLMGDDSFLFVLLESQTEAKVKLNVLGKGTTARVFYWETATFDDVTRYVMYEALFD
jgi:hypothetical protein